MPAVARKGDKSDKTDDFEPSAAVEGAKTVYCNGKPVVTVGSKWGTQVQIKKVPVMDEETGQQKVDSQGNPIFKDEVVGKREDVKSTSGSATVFAEGISIARKGDSLNHGKIAEGSSNTFINS